jgi:septation ring formation regulator EzrA
MTSRGRSDGRVPPLASGPWLGRIGLISLLTLLGIDPQARALDKSPIPAFDGKRVYVDPRVADHYQGLAQQIERLEKAATPTYYVVVVKASGPESDKSATLDYTNALFKTWQTQAESRGLRLDPDRSVVIVVAIDNRQVAVHTGNALRQLGLSGDAKDRELVQPSGFIDLAKDGKYSEAIASHLDTTDSWIGTKDPTSRLSVAQAQVPSPVVSHGGTMGRDVAAGLGLSLLIILAAIMGLLWMVHRRKRARLDQRIKEIRSNATDVMDHLDALKERLKLLPATNPDFRTPMTGETAALHAKIQEAVGQLWDRWLQVMDAIERAQKLAAGITSPFKKKALQDAEETLEQKRVFEEIDAGTKACSADMDRLDQAHPAARGELDTVTAARPKLDAQVETIRKVGLPIAPFQEELTAIAAETDRARELIASDPIGAKSTLEALRTRGEALIARAERVAGLLQEAQKVAATLEGLRRQVAEHRSKGLRLDEEGGNPDETLAKADQAHARSVAALHSGDPDTAAKELETSRSLVEQGQGTIEQVRGSRDYSRREQPERRRATERLQAALPQVEADFQRLQREFAPTSWEGAARNLDLIRERLSGFDRLAADAAEAASDDSQRYLAGAGLLRQLAQQQQEALRLMSRVGEQLNALTAARDECRRRRGELETLGRRVEAEFRQHDPMVSTMALDVLEKARGVRDAVLAAFEEPRPDWPAVRDGLAKAMDGYSVARDQAAVDVRTHQQLADEYQEARGNLERVANLLASRREDRPAANQRFRSAAEVLDQIGLDLSQPHGEWVSMVDQVRGARTDLEQAERLAREDIRLAGQAQSEIEDASRAIDQARGTYAMGVWADTAAADNALARAQQLLGTQQYEQAIESAGQAQHAARRAHQEAVQQASWRQMQADSQRRHWEAPASGPALGDALARGAAVAAGVILGNTLEDAARAASPEPPPADPEPAISPEPPEPDTAVSTWEDDTGQSSW